MDWMSIRGEKDSMSEGKEKWYSTAEAEKVAGVTRQTLFNAIKKGTLVASQISDSSKWGYHYKISESNLLEWVENRNTIKTSNMPMEMTVDRIADWITSEIQKAYETGFKDGMKTAKAKMMEAAKEIR